MLHDTIVFFGPFSPQGVALLLFTGLCAGFGLHDMIIWSYRAILGWYAAKHDSRRDN
jgi:hypothetical protein